jgi:hypothetical protein
VFLQVGEQQVKFDHKIALANAFGFTLEKLGLKLGSSGTENDKILSDLVMLCGTGKKAFLC